MKKLIILFVSIGVITTAAITTYNESKNNLGGLPAEGFINIKDVQTPIATEKTKAPSLPTIARSFSNNPENTPTPITHNNSSKVKQTTNSYSIPQLNTFSNSYSVSSSEKKENNSYSSPSSMGSYSTGILAQSKRSSNENSFSNNIGSTYAFNSPGKQSIRNSISGVLADDIRLDEDPIADGPVLLQPANTPLKDGVIFLLLLSIFFILIRKDLIK